MVSPWRSADVAPGCRAVDRLGVRRAARPIRRWRARAASCEKDAHALSVQPFQRSEADMLKFASPMSIGLGTLLGVLTAVGASAAEPLRVGVPVIFSGPGAFVGAAQKRSLEMQAEQLNAKGGISGRKVELIFYDTEGKPDVAVRMFNRLIKNDRVSVILGPSASWEAMPVKPIVEASNTPTIMLASTAAIVDPVSKCVFKTPPDDRIVVARLYQHLKAAGQTKLALVSSQDAFGDGGRKEILAQAKAAGVEIVFDEKYTMEDADLSPLLNKIKRSNA
ncbi:MAG: ABC transporter substrate-binding protein, partial [Burkholderiales bacterium]